MSLMFQSLLSQGISLLDFAPWGDEESNKQGFNPFLVRASVYCCPAPRRPRPARPRFNPFLVRASVY